MLTLALSPDKDKLVLREVLPSFSVFSSVNSATDMFFSLSSMRSSSSRLLLQKVR